jgi:hypothetical protein
MERSVGADHELRLRTVAIVAAEKMIKHLFLPFRRGRHRRDELEDCSEIGGYVAAEGGAIKGAAVAGRSA